MKRMILALSFLCLAAYAAPERAVWMQETLVGLIENNYLVRQTVRENLNLGSRIESRTTVFLILRVLGTDEELARFQLSDVVTSAGRLVRGRSEDRLVEALREHPTWFYGLEYPVSLGRGQFQEHSYSLNDGTIVLQEESGYNLEVYELRETSMPDGSFEGSILLPRHLLQVFHRNQFLLFLVDYGEPYADRDYHQRIVTFVSPVF